MAELHGGLYYLKVSGRSRINMSNVGLHNINNNVVSDSVCIPKTTLWHFRFGHVSSEKLTMLCKDFPMIHVNKDEVCDVCTLQDKGDYLTTLVKVELEMCLICFTRTFGVHTDFPQYTSTNTS